MRGKPMRLSAEEEDQIDQPPRLTDSESKYLRLIVLKKRFWIMLIFVNVTLLVMQPYKMVNYTLQSGCEMS